VNSESECEYGFWVVFLLLGSAYCRLSIANCLLHAAGCLLHLGEAGWKGLSAGMAGLDKMSPPTGKETSSNVENRTSNAGMSMKKKDRLSAA
jgi:hypothetical protein